MGSYPISAVILVENWRVEVNGQVSPTPPPGDHREGSFDRLLAHLARRFDDILLVAADPLGMVTRDALIVSDHFAPPGLLSGIQAGLFAARHPHALVVTAQAPRLSDRVLDLLEERVAPRWDAVLAEGDAGLQPLPGVFSQRVLKPLTRRLACGATGLSDFLLHVRICKIPMQTIRAVDPDWTPLFYTVQPD